MLSLKDFKKNAISIGGLKSLVEGADEDTPGGTYFFGYGTSQCDTDNGTYDYYFPDGRWLQNAGTPDGNKLSR